MASWSPSDLVPGLYLAGLGWILARALRRWFDPVPGRVWAAFAAALLVLLGPVLVGGKVLLPLEILTRQAPFQVLRENLPHLANRLQLDLITQIAPALALVRREMRGGTWPLWNHLAGPGMPLMADPQSQAFQPLVLLAELLPLPAAVGVIAGLRVLVALAFFFLFLRRQGMGEAPSLLGSLAYSLGGFLLLWLGWPIANSAALLPPLLYAVAISDDRGARRDFLLLALAIWAVLLSGQPETGINDLLLAAAFAAVRWRKRPRGLRGRVALRWALAGLLAAGAAAPPLWATAEYVPQTHRYTRISLRNRKVLSEDWLLGWRTAAQLRFRWEKMRQRLVPLAAPNAYGNNRFGPYWGNENINEDATGFVGGAALLAALLAVAPRRRARDRGPDGSGIGRGSGRLREERLFLAVAALALVVTARPPGLVQAIAALPLFGKSATFQHRVLLPFDLAAAYLAAATLERWRHGEVRRWPIAALAAALAGLVAWAYLADGRPAPPLPPDAIADMRHLSLAANLAALGAAALLLAAWRRPRAATGEGGAAPRTTPARPGEWRLWALAAVAAAELLAIHVPANPGMPRRIYFPTTPSVAFLEHRLGGPRGMRFAALGNLFPPNGAALYDLPDARYTNPMKPWNAAVAMLPLLPAMDEVYDKFLRPEHPLYDLLGVRYMMASPKQALPKPWRLALADPSAWIYERPAALPRLFLPPEAEVDPAVRWPRWLAAQGDLTRRALLAKPPPGTRWRGVWREGALPSTLAPVLLESDHLRAEATLAEARPLASSLYQDGGWRLLVDGRHLPSTLADGPFLGAWLPAGRSRVDLIYRPRSFLPACLLAALALAGAALWWWPRPRRG
jgi:hypothetical protein